MEPDRISINFGWLFKKDASLEAVCPEYDESGFERVTLPHDWQIFNAQTQSAPGGGSQGFYPREEVGVYRYHFTAPENWRGKLVRVLFDGAQRFSEIYLNGKKVGGRKYGYIPVLCELTGLRYGEDNLLSVRLDNRLAEDKNIAGGDRWYSGAGLYRNAWLLVDEQSHIRHDGIFVTAEPRITGPQGDVPDVNGIRVGSAAVRACVENEGLGEEYSLRGAIYCGEECVWEDRQTAQGCNVFELELQNPYLWTLSMPQLYRFEATLLKGETPIDCQSVHFGVRSAVFDEEDGFILNGVKMKLWGVNFHHDGGAFGAAVPIELWRRRLMSAKKLGINAVRCSHNPMAEEFYDLCDELGLLVIDEYCDKWQNSGMYFDLIDDEERLEEIEIMLRRDRNHPSIILWSVGNEVGAQYSEYFFETLKKLCDKVRSLDPTRGVSAALIGFVLPGFNDMTPLGVKMKAVKRYAEIVDVFMGNYMEQLYVKMRECGMRKPIIGSEVRTYYRHSAESMNTVDVSMESPYDIVKEYPWICGAFVWAGCDYLGETGGWPCRGWTGNLMTSIGEPKIRAWYCTAQFKTEPVLKLAVYDESEPWDMARGLWGFPQMRAHWKYNEFEKVRHVAVMTNCDTVKLYQNSQTVRTAYLKDFKDGMVHFHLPYIPGVLRAEGYMNGNLVCEDALYTDYAGDTLSVRADRETLPADGQSVAFIDVRLNDAHGRPYVLSKPYASVCLSGDGEIAALDNGDALTIRDYSDNSGLCLHDGCLLIAVRAPRTPGSCAVTVTVEGFEPRRAEIKFN